MLKDGKGLTKIMKRFELETKFGRSIGQGCTEIMEGKPSDGREYSTWMNVARLSCTRALGDGPRNVEPFNEGVSIETRLFPRRGQNTGFPASHKTSPQCPAVLLPPSPIIFQDVKPLKGGKDFRKKTEDRPTQRDKPSNLGEKTGDTSEINETNPPILVRKQRTCQLNETSPPILVCKDDKRKYLL
ncbi:hypothetical protein TNCV_4962071 [Trichonephila clavipes]|nr:hypothetical protein TNCV_4962071 [Trichonephila clavipes]